MTVFNSNFKSANKTNKHTLNHFPRHRRYDTTLTKRATVI